MLERNVMCLQGNMQPRKGFEGESYREREGQEIRTLEKEHRTVGENKGQEEIPMQWILIEKEKKIEYAMCVGSGAIWPKTVSKERKEREKQQKHCKSW